MSPPPPIAAAADAPDFPSAAAVRLPVPSVRDGTLVGIGFIILSTLFFSLSDVVAKALTDTMDGMQVTWFRYAAFALTIPLGVLLVRGPRGLSTRRPGLQLARGLTMACGSAAFIVGLSMMPVAENTAIAFLGPLFITALSVPLLGETVGIRRWMAALVGFVGVMIVVRPGSEAFQPAAIFPIVAALIGAFGVILTRHMANEAPEATLSWTGLSGFVVMTALMPFFWSAPDLTQVALGLGSGLLSTVGHAFVVLAFRRAGASTLAPFTYVQLLFAGFFAYLVFSTVPSLWTVAGGVVIAASGLYTAHRERVRATEARRAPG